MATITTSFNETNINNINNTSDLTITCYFSPDNQQTYNMSGMALYCTCNGVTQSATVYLPLGGSVTQSFTFTNILHNDDGSKTVNWEWRCNTETSVLGNIIRNGTKQLTTIPRYANITKFTANTIDETNITLSWKTDETINKLWYSKDNGSNWTELNASGTSGTISLTNLSVGTSYNFKLKVRRASNNLVTPNDQAASTSGSTYNYPYVSYVEYRANSQYNGNRQKDTNARVKSYYIGMQQRITIYNPLNRNITIYMKQNNTSGLTLYSVTSNTSGTHTFTPTSSTLFSSIPNDMYGTAIYYCEYDGHIVKNITGRYYIDTALNINPRFTANGFEYTTNLTSLTNNNQIVIDGYSTATINITTPATSNYGANISKYIITWGNATGETSSTSTTLTGKVSGNTITVRVLDSRNKSITVTKTIDSSNLIQYSNPNINEITSFRDNGVEAGVKLSLNGNMFNGKFGSSGVTNALSSAKYYVSTNGTSWSSAYPSDNSMLNAINVSNGNFTLEDFSIHANGSSGGFTIGQQYIIKVVIYDAQGLLSSITSFSVIPDGKISRAVYKDDEGEYHEGINGLPDDDYTQIIHGNLKVTDGYKEYSSDEQIIGKWRDGKTLYQKTFQVTSPSTANSTTWVQSLTNINYDYIAIVKGDYSDTANMSSPVNHFISTSNFSSCWIGKTDKAIEMIVVGSARLSRTCYITIEYTKTTD